ncbi:hypothetical protein Tco_0595135 [Tanacetum coccineum]
MIVICPSFHGEDMMIESVSGNSMLFTTASDKSWTYNEALEAESMYFRAAQQEYGSCFRQRPFCSGVRDSVRFESLYVQDDSLSFDFMKIHAFHSSMAFDSDRDANMKCASDVVSHCKHISFHHGFVPVPMELSVELDSAGETS